MPSEPTKGLNLPQPALTIKPPKEGLMAALFIHQYGWLFFILGCVVGCNVGFVSFAIVNAGARADRHESECRPGDVIELQFHDGEDRSTNDSMGGGDR